MRIILLLSILVSVNLVESLKNFFNKGSHNKRQNYGAFGEYGAFGKYGALGINGGTYNYETLVSTFPPPTAQITIPQKIPNQDSVLTEKNNLSGSYDKQQNLGASGEYSAIAINGVTNKFNTSVTTSTTATAQNKYRPAVPNQLSVLTEKNKLSVLKSQHPPVYNQPTNQNVHAYKPAKKTYENYYGTIFG